MTNIASGYTPATLTITSFIYLDQHDQESDTVTVHEVSVHTVLIHVD